MKLMFCKEDIHQSKAQLEQIRVEIDTLLRKEFSKAPSISVTVEQGGSMY
jgi:hypothetical protein